MLRLINLNMSVCPLIFMCTLRLRVHYWGKGVAYLGVMHFAWACMRGAYA